MLLYFGTGWLHICYLLRRDAASLTSQKPLHCDGPETPPMVPCLAAATCPNDPLPWPTMTLVVSSHSDIASHISLKYNYSYRSMREDIFILLMCTCRDDGLVIRLWK